jgi:hypothetical protein
MDEHHTFFGIEAESLIAGFCGGYVYSYFMHQNTPQEVVGSVLSGGFVANYMGLLIANKMGIPPFPAAFVAGLAWNAICHAVLNYANSNITKGRRNND